MTTARLLAGASGILQGVGKGAFYPQDIKAEDMLAWYSGRLPTVEINNTFYRMPKTEVLANWAASTPERLPGLDQGVAADHPHGAAQGRIGHRASGLSLPEPGGARRQARSRAVPAAPEHEKGSSATDGVSGLLPAGHNAAFEFRNDTWFEDDVYDALKAAGASLCLSEREDNAPPPLVETAPWGYVRLRLETYSDGDLEKWARKLEATSWREIYVYFMHEPTAPAYARALMGFGS